MNRKFSWFICINLLIYLFFAVVAVSFVFSPITGDIKVFLAGARQADFLDGNFIQKVYNQWELKGVLNRMTMYFLYKTGSLFFVFPSFAFERFVSFTYLIFGLLMLFLSVQLIAPKKEIVFKLRYTAVLSSIIFCVQIMSRMQAEMTVSIILVLAFSLYINGVLSRKHENIKLFISGIFIGITILYKTVLILLAVSFVAGCYLWDKKNGEKPTFKKFMLLFIGGLFALVLGFASILLINPQEIQNILDASLFQSTLFSGGGRSLKAIIKMFAGNYLNSAIGSPFILLGTFAAISLICNYIKQKQIDCVLMLFVLWGIPSTIIILANCYFYYHYYIFTLPAILNIYLCYNKEKEMLRLSSQETIIGVLPFAICIVIISFLIQNYSTLLYASKMYKIEILLMLLMILASIAVQIQSRNTIRKVFILASFGLVFFNYVTYINVFSRNTRVYNRLTKEVFGKNSGIAFDRSQIYLYLDDGSGSYAMGNKSYSVYYYPLPLQRIHDSSLKAQSDFYKKIENDYLAFSGEYITTQDDWFFLNGNNEKLRQKINTEYTKDFDLFRWSVPQSLFENLDNLQLTVLNVYHKSFKD